MRKFLIGLVAVSLILTVTACKGKTAEETTASSAENTTSSAEATSEEASSSDETEATTDESSDTEAQSELTEPENTAVLRTVLGSLENAQSFEYGYSGELTPEKLIEGLGSLTWLDFSANVTVDGKNYYVEWAATGSLIGGLGNKEQNPEFHIFDVDTLNCFMLDSLYYTLLKNFGDDISVYYKAEGKDVLDLTEQIPNLEVLSFEKPFLGSAAHRTELD